MITEYVSQSHPGQKPSKVLFASKRVLLIGWLASGVIIAFWLWIFPKNPFSASLAIFLFGLIFTSVPIFLFTKTPRLNINEEGIALTNFVQTRSVRWTEIENIRVGWSNTGNALWSFNKSLFVNYRREGRNELLVIRPLYFGIKSDRLVNEIIPYCCDYPKLTETLLADCAQGALL